MCMQQQQVHKLHYFFPQNRSRVRILRLSSKRKPRREDDDMELENLKLYMKNMSIIQENEKMRKQANLLHKENLVLMSQLQRKILKSVV